MIDFVIVLLFFILGFFALIINKISKENALGIAFLLCLLLFLLAIKNDYSLTFVIFLFVYCIAIFYVFAIKQYVVLNNIFYKQKSSFFLASMLAIALSSLLITLISFSWQMKKEIYDNKIIYQEKISQNPLLSIQHPAHNVINDFYLKEQNKNHHEKYRYLQNKQSPLLKSSLVILLICFGILILA
jgi:hypothetical protein